MSRHDEIRSLLRLSANEVRQRAGNHLVVCENVEALYNRMAADMAAEIEAHAASGEPLKLIVPVGPTGQYPLLARLISQRNLSLAHVWWFFMDEYCGDDGRVLNDEHPLSFRRMAEATFFQHLPHRCGLVQEQVIFPTERNIGELPQMIADVGGIDTCYGGIGIHGHVAFNEPQTGIADLGARKVRLNDYTVTINAIRAEVGGNLENFPRYAYTLGMKEILSARRIRLYCRNGINLDWANTVLRLALFGERGDDYPVTHIRSSNYVIVTDEDTLRPPRYIL